MRRARERSSAWSPPPRWGPRGHPRRASRHCPPRQAHLSRLRRHADLLRRGLDTFNGYDTPSGTLRLPLFGNHWPLAPGHRIRLDLSQVDEPFLRPNNLPSSITYGTPKLVLPTRKSGDCALTGAP